ncbi:cytochrome b/b6 domain-containing protein [Nocardioides sp. HB32]
MSDQLPRFAAVERVVHGTLGVLMIACLLTAAVLYNGSLALAVGHRHAVELVHVWSGFGLPVPLLLGAASSAYRTDVRRLNRFTPADWQWLRSKDRRSGRIRVGKFNAGQKLNAALSAGAILLLLGTGTLMFFTGLVRLAWRSGATFVHDWVALALGLLVIGHLVFALRDGEALRGMWSGRVSARWARREHAAWVDEVRPPPAG